MTGAELADVVVAGAGIAGAAVACELATDHSVVVVEAEAIAGVHATGRSAAVLALSYGSAPVRAATRAGLDLVAAADRPHDAPVLRPCPVLWFAGPDGHGEQRLAELAEHTPEADLLTAADTLSLHRALRPEAVSAGLVDHSGRDIDVHALHQGYLRELRARGGRLRTAWRIAAADHVRGRWRLTDTAGRRLEAPVLVDAAGAWAAEVARLAGAERLPLRTVRRTAFVSPAGAPARPPMLVAADGRFYVKPEHDRYLCSPIDATPHPPGDSRPDELEIARALDHIGEATRLGLRSVSAAWAGVQCLTEDGLPVVGRSPSRPGFFWLVGLGGFGIQTAPALARLAAGLVRGTAIAAEFGRYGIDAGTFAPDRFTGQ